MLILCTTVFCAADLLLSRSVRGEVESASQRPNIVLIILDDLGPRDPSCYGSTVHETPALDRIADEGMKFTNAYAAYPRCVSSRTGLLSGKYPCRVEYAAIKNKDKDHHLPLSEVTFGEALRDGGYQTCFIGKWHLGNEGGDPGAQGFDTVVHAGSAGATGDYFFPFETEKGLMVVNPVDGQPGDYLNDRLTDKAIDYIRSASQQESPFLMVLSHYAVHTPFQAPDDRVQHFRKKLRKAQIEVGGKRDDDDYVQQRNGLTKTLQNNPTYAAMLENADQGIARILETLSATGVDNNTLLIVTSDHGGLSTRGENNRRPCATSNLPYQQGKGSVLEGGIRVPLLVRWPGKVAAGSQSEVQVTGTDIFPTLLESAGLPLMPDQHVDGISFTRALDGESYQRPPMFWNKWMARPDSTGDDRALALIDGNYKLIQWLDDDSLELFDLRQDPGETTNLADQHPDRVASMQKQMLALEQETGDLRKRGQQSVQRRLERAANKGKSKSKKNRKSESTSST